MPRFRLVNTIDCYEEDVINLIKGTNGDRFIAGYSGHGSWPIAPDSKLIFEVNCENKPYGDQGITWDEENT